MYERHQNILHDRSPLKTHLRQSVPGVDLVDLPDVVSSGVDGEQAGVGVVELKKYIIINNNNNIYIIIIHFSIQFFST